MNTSAASLTHDSIKNAVLRACPDRPELRELHLDGSLTQVWQAVARVLGIETDALADLLAPQFELEPAGSLSVVEPAAINLLPFSFCRQNLVLPLRLSPDGLVIATADPSDEGVRERTGFLANRRVRWVLAAPDLLDDAILAAYSAEAARDLATHQQSSAVSQHSVPKLARQLLRQAIEQRASDIHFQPYLGAAVVRIRVDGALRRLTSLSDALAMMVVRHFKAQGGMDPSNMQIPQDGRMSLVHEGRDFDLRISSLPATRGERLVIRFLDQSKVLRLSSVGFSHAALQAMRRAIARPSGMVIMTGPTGSGKTSTLYALLTELNRSSVNIITVENPVEYRIAGISQVEVNDRAGRTFHSALRSILRQDPDIVLVGEMRDEETAEIATQAALTGHLVLSTLHTNDAITAIPRLLNMKVQPSILADSLAAIVAQRLCRALCRECRIPVNLPLTPEERAFEHITRNQPVYRPLGCKHCDFTGYYGRLPIVEIIMMNAALRDAIARGESRLSVLDTLREEGLRSLAVSGAQRILSGDTTVSEVRNVVGPSFWPELAGHFGVSFEEDPDADAGTHLLAGQAVLLIGDDPELASRIGEALVPESLRLIVAASPAEARARLQQDEDIAFIIGDLGAGLSKEEAAAQLRANRLEISWARLPAVVLLPESLADHEDPLRESGVLAEFLQKPFSMTALLQHIRSAQAR